MQFEFEGNSFGFKKIFDSFFRYKWINLLIVFLSILLGILYYYLKQPVYQSTTTIEISTNPKENRIDFFDQKNGNNVVVQKVDTATEIDILKSDFLLTQTLKNINMNINYFQEENFKNRAIYKNNPYNVKSIKVKNNKAYNKTFVVKYIDQNKFKLIVKRGSISKFFDSFAGSNSKKINTVFKYGQRVQMPNCSFIINKKGRYSRAVYSFSLNPLDSVVKSLRKRISIKTASIESSVLKITYVDTIAKRAKEFLNLFVQNYLIYSKSGMIEVDNKTLQFINQQLGEISQKLENSEDQLQNYKSSNNMPDIDVHKRQIVEKLHEFEVEYKRAQVEFDVIKNLHNSVKNGQFNAISSIGRNYPALDTMLRTLDELNREKEDKSSVLTEYHPDIISISNNINDTKYAILQTSQGIYSRAAERIKRLQIIVKNYISKIKKLPKIEQELVKHKRYFDVNDEIYNYLLKKQSELSIEKASTTLNKKVLDYAKQARRPISPKLGMILPTSAFLGLLLALLHSILRDQYDTKIKNRYDINYLTDIPIFGMIPFIKDSANYNGAYVLDRPNSNESESIREIKNNLEYSANGTKSKVILVTSTVPNEGKTTLSANLASVLGMGEKKAIILSLDLRRPELHHKFLLSNKIGMSDILSGKKSIKEATWENEKFNNLNIVTSGPIPPNPAELLASSAMSRTIQTLKQEYDYIVLDTPPFEYVNDAIELLKHSDIVLFVIKSEFSEKKYVKDIDNLVDKLGIKNSGIILNSVKQKHQIHKKFDYRYIYHEA